MKNFYMDVNFKRVVKADRRVNQGLSTETITSQRNILAHDYHWLSLTNATTQVAMLPDATTLSNGFSQVVYVPGASAAAVSVCTYDATTPVEIKNVLPGRAYRFTLLTNGTAAGTWHIDYLEEADLIPSARYLYAFNATTDWGTASGGYYTITLNQSTHTRGTTPVYQFFEGSSSPYADCGVESQVNSSGDVSFKVPSDPDLRFAGRLVLI